MTDGSTEAGGDPHERRVTPREAVTRWMAAADAAGSVNTGSKLWMRGRLWQSASATITDSGDRFRIDGRNHVGDTSVTSMIVVDEAAWVSRPHDPDERDEKLDWVAVPEGPEADHERYRWVFNVAHPYPRFSDPWRILPLLLGVPGYSVETEGTRGVWRSVPLNELPAFWRFGSVPKPVFTVTVTCDINDLPGQIEMLVTSADAPQKSLAWDVTLRDWGTTSQISPPPPTNVIPLH